MSTLTLRRCMSQTANALRLQLLVGQKSTAPSLARCITTGSATRQDYGGTSMLDNPRIMITGSLGQLGQGLAKVLRNKYGRDNVIMSDIVKAPKHIHEMGPFLFADILDFKNLQEIIVNEGVDWLIHFSALLSAIGEHDVPLAIKVNIQGLHNVMELSKMYSLKLFIPSTIGAFGPESPKRPTPDLTIQRPKTIYGVSKVHAELMGEYYHHRFGVDFRSLRLPGVISGDTEPGGGTTDYASSIFDYALTTGNFECYLREDTLLPMIYIDDCLRAIVEMMEVPEADLKMRTYNISALSFTPTELAEQVKKYIPHLDVTYRPDGRQDIADAWPQVFDDTNARNHWGWRHHYDLEKMVDIMYQIVSHRLRISPPVHTDAAAGR